MSVRKNFTVSYGLVAQLGERRVRNAEVEGSIPFGSTKRSIAFMLSIFFIFKTNPAYPFQKNNKAVTKSIRYRLVLRFYCTCFLR